MTSEIKKVVVVDAPPAVVFRALTDEKELVQWMPREAKMDARVGGRYEFKFYWEARKQESAAKERYSSWSPAGSCRTPSIR